MVCLFMTGEVVCVWNGGISKIKYGNVYTLIVVHILIWVSSFPAHALPSNNSTYRPPQAVLAPAITKLVCCDDLFAALSSNGEVDRRAHV